jgi:hypothetical protein
MARSGSLRVVDPEPTGLPGPISVDVPGSELAPGVTLEDGALKVEHGDGSVTVDLNPDLSEKDDGKDNFYANLASKLDEAKLAEIATELLEGIERDELSRKEWLDTRAKGITLLGLKIEDPSTDAGTANTASEAVSKVRHPLLLEATIRFQATARGELLPASGPLKIRNDSTMPPRRPKEPPPQPPMVAPPPMAAGPPQLPGAGGGGGLPVPPGSALPPPPASPMMGHNGGPPLQETEELAEALEKDMNHYLTVTATEYVPDTDRMLFYVGFGGDGFKKVYNCPLRRRPVSESVDAEDLIVSNAATDLRNCGRITHKIKMRKSTLRRMQIVKAYRDVSLTQPTPLPKTAVETKKEEIDGRRSNQVRPEDQDYTIYETQCELELDEFAPEQFKGKGLPLPYRVTLERDSKQVLAITRNWKKDDEQCLSKQFFVQFPFIRGLGFYGIGFIHLLGNTTNALTAAWREMLDAGMFANFPGFIYSKMAGRQLTNQFRVPPGGGIPLELGAMQDIRQAVMALPYKEPGPSFTAFVQHVEEVGARVGQTAEINVGEGKQDAPVGTTLALIEQATKTIDAVHKRMHAAQAEEFGLLKERFREDPEAFWRHNKKPTLPWKKEQFLAALENNDLVPVADPNNPTSLHRIAKALAIKQLQQASPLLYDPVAVDQRIFRIVGIDPEGLFRDKPAPAPPDPKLEAIKEKAKAGALQQQVMDADSKRKMQIAVMQLQDKVQDRESKEKIEMLRVRIEALRLQSDHHANEQEVQREWQKARQELAIEQERAKGEMEVEQLKNAGELHMDMAGRHQEIQMQGREHEHDLEKDRRKHQQDMDHASQKHAQKMAHDEEMHKKKLAHEEALAKIRKSAAAKKP